MPKLRPSPFHCAPLRASLVAADVRRDRRLRRRHDEAGDGRAAFPVSPGPRQRQACPRHSAGLNWNETRTFVLLQITNRFRFFRRECSGLFFSDRLRGWRMSRAQKTGPQTSRRFSVPSLPGPTRRQAWPDGPDAPHSPPRSPYRALSACQPPGPLTAFRRPCGVSGPVRPDGVSRVHLGDRAGSPGLPLALCQAPPRQAKPRADRITAPVRPL